LTSGWRTTKRATLLGCVGIGLTAGTSGAQDVNVTTTWRLTIDNDFMALRGGGPPPDFDYTHGTLLSVSLARAPAFLQQAMSTPACRSDAPRDRGCLTTGLAIGQEIFTPRRDSTAAVPGERPYAGTLYAAAILNDVSSRRTRSLRLDIGVTGRPSLAAEAQKALHVALGNQPQLGWATQFPARASVAVAISESHSRDFTLGKRSRVSLRALGGVLAGNLRTAIHVGALLEVEAARGKTLVPDIATRLHAPGWYGFLGVQQNAVVADALITGAASDRGATLRPFVAEWQAGFGFRGRRLALEYRDVVRSREYDAQPHSHAYGSLTMRLFFH
jgi:lipid A 3-O-deacylase